MMEALIHVILLLTINSLFVIGMYEAMKFSNSDLFDNEKDKYLILHGKPKGIEKDILWWVRWYASEFPWYVRKPLYYCPKCMSSLWSIPVYWYFMPLSVDSVIIYLFYIPALAALNVFVTKKFDL
jgi:hypothetical protein